MELKSRFLINIVLLFVSSSSSRSETILTHSAIGSTSQCIPGCRLETMMREYLTRAGILRDNREGMIGPRNLRGIIGSPDYIGGNGTLSRPVGPPKTWDPKVLFGTEWNKPKTLRHVYFLRHLPF